MWHLVAPILLSTGPPKPHGPKPWPSCLCLNPSLLMPCTASVPQLAFTVSLYDLCTRVCIRLRIAMIDNRLLSLLHRYFVLSLIWFLLIFSIFVVCLTVFCVCNMCGNIFYFCSVFNDVYVWKTVQVTWKSKLLSTSGRSILLPLLL